MTLQQRFGDSAMFLKVYESRDVYFPADNVIVRVTRFPNGEYGVTGENDEGVYKGIGSTPMEAIADYRATVQDETQG
jgi:hypothetical protein